MPPPVAREQETERAEDDHFRDEGGDGVDDDARERAVRFGVERRRQGEQERDQRHGADVVELRHVQHQLAVG